MTDGELRILTGAPGSGKTAILDLLADSVHCVGEPARRVLADQRAIGGRGTPDRDPGLFVELLLERSIADHRAAEAVDGPVLFDRGIPDCVAYAQLLEVDVSPSIDATERHRYHSEVLILEPWEDIYVTDDERTMSFVETLGFHSLLVDAYERAGYQLIVVPRRPAEDRAGFVRDRVIS